MSVAGLLNQTITIYRLAATSGSKKQFGSIGTARIFIAPMSSTAASIAGIAFSRAFQGFVLPSANVKIGDYLQTDAGDKYDIQGSRNYAMGTQPYIELTLQKQVQQGEI